MKGWRGFVLCLLLSLGIWLIHNISQPVTDVVSVPLVAKSALIGRSEKSSDTVTILARVRAQGYYFLYYRFHHKPLEVYFYPEDFIHVGGDEFTMTSIALERYAGFIFPDYATVESYLRDSYTFKFSPEDNKKVPVKPVTEISYKPQYTSRGEIQVIPDSVYVYGPPSLLSTIDVALTRPVSISDVSSSIHGMARLEKIPGARISDKEVSYSVDVVRYVEMKSNVRIGVRNAPSDVDFLVYPANVEAVFKCIFPTDIDPSEPAEFFIDYDEFAHSLTGKCVIHCEGLPESVLDCRMNPEVCDCMIKDSGI